MKIYLAARYSRLPTINQWAYDLRATGHRITSRWAFGKCHLAPGEYSQQAQEAARQRFAMDDIEDIQACDCCISLMEEPRGDGRGGRHVEFGVALALGKRLMIVGPKETVFHCLPDVEVFETWEQLMNQLHLEDALSAPI